MSIPSGPLAPSRPDIKALEAQALGCLRCPLSQSRTQVVWADGNLDSDILFIGEAPGFHEDKEGRPFVGAAGQLLDKLLGEVGLDRTQVAIVNVLKCRPPGNRDPHPDEIEACRPYLEGQLDHMQPRVIITLGNFATRFIIGEPIGITKARGRRYSFRGAAVIPTFHPAAALRGGRFGGIAPIDAIRQDLQMARSVIDAPPPTPPAPAARGETSSVPDSSQQLGLF